MQPLLTIWILISTFCSIAGWLLSAGDGLEGLGAVVAIGSASICVFILRVGDNRVAVSKAFRVYSSAPIGLRYRVLALGFSAVVLLSLIGGLINPPTSHDAFTYRIPRILHWWFEGQWHWITTPNLRMNYSAPGFEWLMLPLLQLTRTDRFFFLLNLLPYLLLPGLLFSVFRQVGVSPRVAWAWMWIIPASYCFALQAGSIGNDSFAAIYLLGSIYFALRANAEQRVSCFCLAILASALLSGAKASNLPLLLPCAIALWPAFRLPPKRPLPTVGVIFVALLVSFGPMALLNRHYAGHWSGDPTNREQMQIRNPAVALTANSLQLMPQTVMPPAFPSGRKIEQKLTALLPEGFREWLYREYPRFRIRIGELPQEEWVGLGMAVSILCLLSIGGRLLRKTPEASLSYRATKPIGVWIALGGWAAFIVYMGKMGSEAIGRLLSPYYTLLLLPMLFHPINTWLVRRKWWMTLAILATASTLGVLILTPSRPLWPATKCISFLRTKFPNNQQLARAEDVYRVYGNRHDLLAPLRCHLPHEASVVGLISGGDDSEVGLWRPFGERRVIHLPGKSAWSQETEGLQWIAGKSALIPERYGKTLEEWVSQSGGTVVSREIITSKVSTGPEEWFVARLQ